MSPHIPHPHLPTPPTHLPTGPDVIKTINHFTDQLNSLNLENDVKEAIEKEAEKLANNYNSDHPDGDFDDCVTIVAAGAAAEGAIVGGPLGAAIGAGAGIPAARIACRRIFKE